MRSEVPVSEAARELGLTEQRIRALISADRLDAQKVGGRWLVDVDSLGRRKKRNNLRGRPLSSENAWAYLYLLSGEDPEWLSPWSRSRLLRALREKRVSPSALDRRAERRDYYCHPGLLRRFEKDPRVVRSGISGARQYGLDVLARDSLEGYVKKSDLPSLVKRFRLSPSRPANVILREVDGFWPFARDRVAPIGVVAYDLIDAADERSRRAGIVALRKLEKEAL